MILALTNQALVIQENQCFRLENYQVEVLSYLGLLSADIHYFKVNVSTNGDTNTGKLGLLRVGSSEGGLSRELQLREVLGDYGMISPLLAYSTEESVAINPPLQLTDQEQERTEDIVAQENEAIATGVDYKDADSPLATEELSEDQQKNLDAEVPSNNIEATSEYLEEEYYPEKEVGSAQSQQKLIVLTYLPEEHSTLEAWLKEDHSQEECLSLAVQVCQGFSYLFQRQWCFANLLPQLIQIGTPLKFFDLTTAYPIGEKPSSGIIGNYCAPELASGHPFDELMSSYTVGALLYQAIHNQPLPSNQQLDTKIQPIPQIHQLLKICLSPLPEERFPLSQLLNLLVTSRNSFRTPKIHWNIASHSTVGLSTDRLQNEDNYGVKQQLSNAETFLLGVVADGMGGLSQGEVASKIAVQTVLSEPVPQDFKTEQQRADWLVALFQKANQAIAESVRDGGTTLSVVLAIANKLMIAHVGDSRIYRVRKGEIQQLSEDHSLVAMLVASGQITYEESLEHPDRSVLTKSLGSKQQLSKGYVQDLSRTAKTLSMLLEDGDLLLLCSDGVWDLLPTEELAEIFRHPQLQSAVDKSMALVLERGASDNATLLALQCSIKAN